MAAKALADKEQSQASEPGDCSNCESSLLHVSEALSKEQKKLENYEDKEKAETTSKWANFLVILLFGALAHHLNHLKMEHPEKEKYYERKLSHPLGQQPSPQNCQ